MKYIIGILIFYFISGNVQGQNFSSFCLENWYLKIEIKDSIYQIHQVVPNIKFDSINNTGDIIKKSDSELLLKQANIRLLKYDSLFYKIECNNNKAYEIIPIVKKYYENGNIAIKYSYKIFKGSIKLHGKVKYFDLKGNIYKIIYYKRGNKKKQKIL